MEISRFIENVSACTEQIELDNLLIDEMSRAGVSAFAVQPLPIGVQTELSSCSALISTFPNEAVRLFRLGSRGEDPFFVSTLTMGRPVHYSRLRKNGYLSDIQHELYRSYESEGILDGCAMMIMAKIGVYAYCSVGFSTVRDEIPHFVLRQFNIIFSEYFSRVEEISDSISGELSDREHQILTGISRGFSNAEMAAEYFISTSTIDTYVRRIFEKLGVNNRTEAVLRYFGFTNEK